MCAVQPNSGVHTRENGAPPLLCWASTNSSLPQHTEEDNHALKAGTAESICLGNSHKRTVTASQAVIYIKTPEELKKKINSTYYAFPQNSTMGIQNTTFVSTFRLKGIETK